MKSNIWKGIIEDYEATITDLDFRKEVLLLLKERELHQHFIGYKDDDNLDLAMQALLDAISQIKKQILLDGNENLESTYKTCFNILENLYIIHKNIKE